MIGEIFPDFRNCLVPIVPTIITVCPWSSDPFYIASLLYKMGHYFLDILYDGRYPIVIATSIIENLTILRIIEVHLYNI